MREGAPGGRSPGGLGVQAPCQKRPRRGPEGRGAVFIRPLGSLILVSPRTRGPTLSQISIVVTMLMKTGPLHCHHGLSIPAHRGVCTPWLKQHGQPRKWSAREIAAESMREPDACPHVEQPQPPQVLHGCTPAEAAKLAHDWADGSKDAKGRKLRADGLALAAGVVSLPAEQRQDWPRFREATVAWLREQYGERLRSVVEHTDEAHPHLHFYAVPLPERFECFTQEGRPHQKRPAKGPRGRTERRIQAGHGGVAGWLSRAVAAHFGLTRRGPGKRRLTRGAWKAEQEQARSLAQPVPARADHHPQDVTKRVTKAGLLGKQYESGKSWRRGSLSWCRSGRGLWLRRRRGRSSTASRLPAWCSVCRCWRHRQHGAGRAGRGRRRSCAELEAERRKAAKAYELAEWYQSGRDAALDELAELRNRGPSLGHH